MTDPMRESMEAAERPVRLRRARMRAWRRGMKEMDLILGGFFDAEGETLNDAELDAFEDVLALPDQALYAWIAGRPATLSPGEAATAMVERIARRARLSQS